MDNVASGATDLSIEELRQANRTSRRKRMRMFTRMLCFPFAPANGEYVQTGSAPNFQGGLITLCTCKHSMRATLTPRAMASVGVWVAGLTSWDPSIRGKQQSLVYFMRVGEGLRLAGGVGPGRYAKSGRSEVVDAKRFDPTISLET